MNDERRKNDRVSFSHSLHIRRVDSPMQAAASARDLSICGMSFATEQPFAVGDEIRIHIQSVMEQSAIAARVRHVDAEGGRYLVGVEHCV